MAIVLVGLLGLQLWSARNELRLKPDPRQVSYVGADACTDCHADRHASWARTFHRTMTQEASPQATVGRFDGQSLAAFGGLVKPGSDGQQFWFDYADPASGAPLTRLQVARLVGSHRYQQYLSKDPESETYYRLHYLWHIADQRWVHLNAAFLGSDQQPFDAQVTVWNATCVSCHNTGPRPRLQNLAELRQRAASGEAVDIKQEMRFDTQVAELGISCESCHGPGAEHVARMHGLTRRWLSKLAGVADASIVQPNRLDARRSNAVCGACHAGRTPKSLQAAEQIYQTGMSYRPGDILEDHETVLKRNTPSPSVHAPDLFANRFWADGSPRLTAYEYQGQGSSKCAIDGELTCLRCHTMHSGNPESMLPENGHSNTACLRCHREYKGNEAVHSGHAPDSAGNNCMSCHMPRAVYGVMTIHRTHLIAVPDVAADLRAGKPNACLNCHADKTPTWAHAESQKRWPKRVFAEPAIRLDQAPLGLADGLAGLLAGDSVRQAVTAFELGRVEQAASKSQLLVRIPWLLAALEDDRPAIRRFSQQSLIAISQTLANSPTAIGLHQLLAEFDFTGSAESRNTLLARLQTGFAGLDKSNWPAPAAESGLDRAYQLDPQLREQLRQIGAADDKQIDVGE